MIQLEIREKISMSLRQASGHLVITGKTLGFDVGLNGLKAAIGKKDGLIRSELQEGDKHILMVATQKNTGHPARKINKVIDNL